MELYGNGFAGPQQQRVTERHRFSIGRRAGKFSFWLIGFEGELNSGWPRSPRERWRVSPQQLAVGLGDEWALCVDVLRAVQVKFAAPYAVLPEVLGVEGKLNVAQRDDNASRGLGHRRMPKKLPGRVVGWVGFFRLAKRLESEGEGDCCQGNDTFG